MFRTGNPCGFNKGHNSKFFVGSRVQQTPEEGWRTYRLKRCGNKDNSLKTLNDKRELMSETFMLFLPSFGSHHKATDNIDMVTVNSWHNVADLKRAGDTFFKAGTNWYEHM